MPDALLVAQPTVSEQTKENAAFHKLVHPKLMGVSSDIVSDH